MDLGLSPDIESKLTCSIPRSSREHIEDMAKCFLFFFSQKSKKTGVKIWFSVLYESYLCKDRTTPVEIQHWHLEFSWVLWPDETKTDLSDQAHQQWVWFHKAMLTLKVCMQLNRSWLNSVLQRPTKNVQIYGNYFLFHCYLCVNTFSSKVPLY